MGALRRHQNARIRRKADEIEPQALDSGKIGRSNLMRSVRERRPDIVDGGPTPGDLGPIQQMMKVHPALEARKAEGAAFRTRAPRRQSGGGETADGGATRQSSRPISHLPIHDLTGSASPRSE
jgi:hypothetical protein